MITQSGGTSAWAAGAISGKTLIRPVTSAIIALVLNATRRDMRRSALQTNFAQPTANSISRFPSAPAEGPDGHWMLPSQSNLFSFMADHKGFAVAQRVFHFPQTDFDFQ